MTPPDPSPSRYAVRSPRRPSLARSLGAAAALACLVSCSSTGPESSRYVPPERNYGPYGARDIEDGVAPPPHNLPRHEYPFDSRGNYVSSWAR